MSKFLTILNVFLLLIFLSIPALAEEIEVKAYVNNTEVRLGQSVTLTVEINGSIDVAEPYFDIDNARVQYYGPSTEVRIINGKQSKTLRHIYSLTPTQTGTINIPAIKINYNDKNYSTKPITLNVSNTTGSQNQTLEEQIKQYVFLEIEIPKNQVYVNEKFPLTVKLYYHQSVDLQNIHFPEMNVDSFVAENFPKPAQDMELRNGKYYHVIPFKTNVQAISKGKYNLSSIMVQAELIVPRQNNQGNSMFDSFFEPNYDLIPIELTADDLTIEVLDLPQVDRPIDFNGAVGNFDLDLTISPKQVKPGEPITIRSKITGKGNFNTVTGPVIAREPQFKYYEAQTVATDTKNQNQQRQEKIFEQVIIPLEKTDSLPAISFSYFNPDEEQYHTIHEDAIPIQVIGSETTTSSPVDYRQANNAEQILGEDILYIKGGVGRLVPIGQIAAPAYKIFNLILGGIFLCGLGMRWLLNRENPLLKRRKEFTLRTQQILKNSGSLIEAGENIQFYNQLYQTIQNYLKEYYQITITGISQYETEHLLKAGMPVVVLEKIKEFFADIDEKRFAGYYSTNKDMELILDKAREIVTLISKGEVA